MEKLKLSQLSQDDLAVVSNAASLYAEALGSLLEQENHSQQHIHHSILTEFRYEILKRLTRRDPSPKNSLKLEVHTAFVVYDSLQHYSRQAASQLEAAICRRLIIELFAMLPFTRDHQNLSVMSDLNFK